MSGSKICGPGAAIRTVSVRSIRSTVAMIPVSGVPVLAVGGGVAMIRA
ncbi:hypothetical protein KCH_25730 [Kitasatospora cheerisanensis KCTC 2395]|uniref:Uncharacterized protein n=1 Tax=Kitasatospora cheerisanensis KCTC 2395 TaxID=1348663 RepID=A0A066Z0B7_9ACTN|nr:hypothetical protein KCH_25730 [Kitasatospora cheerisanensis KCTC 2395]